MSPAEDPVPSAGGNGNSSESTSGSSGLSTAAQGPVSAAQMEALIHTYFAACNAADVEGIARCFVPEAVHYFPPGMYGGAFRGARTIGERWRSAVETLGSRWTVDRLVCDEARQEAAIEWTHFKTAKNTVLRGAEWYEFDAATGLIREIRAYYASPQDPALARLELEGFDYAGRGYALEPPAVPRTSR